MLNLGGTMNNLCTKLNQWGCDIPGAMRRFLDDEDLYTSCLATMLADDSFEKLGMAIQENDVTKAFDAAHSLKGTLGNMGLTPMYEIIIQIVEPLRDGKLDGIAEKYEVLMAKKAELVAIKESC